MLEVQDLRVRFALGHDVLHAVAGVGFEIAEGETLALVGESGCGKSTTARAILGLVPARGRVLFAGRDVLAMRAQELRKLRSQMQMVFQDPYGSLNPRMRVDAIVGEGLAIHGLGDRKQRRRRVADLLERVGLVAADGLRYPHAFSGGQRQRIGLARALATDPRLIVCDEAVSALDVSVQAQVIALLQDLQAERRLAYLFIAHDLAVVRHVAHRVAVMYLGRIVEYGEVDVVFSAPQHPYTRGLLESVPPDSPSARRSAAEWCPRSELPSPLHPPSGCAYRTRCPIAKPSCAAQTMTLTQLGHDHAVACREVTTDL